MVSIGSKRSPVSKDSNVWEVAEARARFDDLLASAASRGPQIVRSGHQDFKLTLSRSSSSPKGRALLSKGGPLEDDDSLGD